MATHLEPISVTHVHQVPTESVVPMDPPSAAGRGTGGGEGGVVPFALAALAVLSGARVDESYMQISVVANPMAGLELRSVLLLVDKPVLFAKFETFGRFGGK
jgi:hypothetical protein